jgi:hypothetical protein
VLSPQDEWAPITDADLFEEEEVAKEVVEEEEELILLPPAASLTPPPYTVPKAKNWPRKRRPVYTADDWLIFNYWVRKKGYSIDMAAHCAGITVYDALVALQARDPWFYEFAVMISPQGKSSLSPRRRRGFAGRLGADRKSDQGYKPRQKPKSAPIDKRQSEIEARNRFLALLGDKHPEDRIDGKWETNRLLTAVHPGTGKKRKQKRVNFKSWRCKHCLQLGHHHKKCRNKGRSSVTAGSKTSTTTPPKRYESGTTEDKSP